MRRNLIEICRLLLGFGFIDEKSVDGAICRHANTVTCVLKMALADVLLARRLISKMNKSSNECVWFINLCMRKYSKLAVLK